MLETDIVEEKIKSLEINENDVSVSDDNFNDADKDNIHNDDVTIEIDVHQSLQCPCEATKKLSEVMKVNHLWAKDYNLLWKECERLRKIENQLEDLKIEFEEIKVMTLENSKHCVDEEKGILTASSPQGGHDIDLLKEQLKVYQEDFNEQKDETKKLFMENCGLKTNLQKANDALKLLTSKKSRLKEKYMHVRIEKERLVTELKRLTNDSMDSVPVLHTLQTRMKDSDSIVSEDVLPHMAQVILPPSARFPSTRNKIGNK